MNPDLSHVRPFIGVLSAMSAAMSVVLFDVGRRAPDAGARRFSDQWALSAMAQAGLFLLGYVAMGVSTINHLVIAILVSVACYVLWYLVVRFLPPA